MAFLVNIIGIAAFNSLYTLMASAGYSVASKMQLEEMLHPSKHLSSNALPAGQPWVVGQVGKD